MMVQYDTFIFFIFVIILSDHVYRLISFQSTEINFTNETSITKIIDIVHIVINALIE